MCKLGDLCVSKHRVFYRGKFPCDILFIGEAPTEVDLATKEPIQPRSDPGRVLDQIIQATCPDKRILVANAVACYPFADESLSRARTAKNGEASACSLRIRELIALAKPTYIVSLGKLADQQLTGLKIEHLALQHPNPIARQEESGAVDLKRCVLKLRAYIE